MIDERALLPYLEAHVAGFRGPATFEKFSGGQSNPTFKVQAASGTYVLRRQPPGKLLPSAHAVDREYRVMAALADTDVPVPGVLHLCTDKSVLGSQFYLMGFCDGRVFWDAALPELDREQRGAIYDEMNRVLVNLHSVDVETVGLADYGSPGNYYARQYQRWQQQYRASELQPIKAMESLIDWLGDNLPEDDGRIALVHGDYRLDNLVFAHDAPRVIAVLDWELSTLGHPFADLGYQCMQFSLPRNVGSISGLSGCDLGELGIPDQAAYVARYCERSGLENIDNVGFYVAFSFFRLAAIVQGVARRAADGNASNTEAAALGRYVQPLAMLGLRASARD